MKAVAANSRFRQRARKCKGSGNVRLSVMKCCIETGQLRQVWIQLRQRFNTSKVMRADYTVSLINTLDTIGQSPREWTKLSTPIARLTTNPSTKICRPLDNLR